MNNKETTICQYLINQAIQNRRHARDLWIAADREPCVGTGTEEDPISTHDQASFDALMSLLPSNWAIRFHSGHYYTQGCCASMKPRLGDNFWRLLSRQQLLGAGMNKTIISMVPSADMKSTPNQRWSVLGTDDYAHLTSGVVVRDLTLDANMQAMPTSIIGGGIFLLGSENLVERVRVVNWGAGLDTSAECFAAAMGGGHQNLGMDSAAWGNRFVDCIGEAPIPDQGSSGSTCFIIGMCGENPSTLVQLHGRDNGIRGCVVRGNDPSHLIRGFTIGGRDGFVEDCRVEAIKVGYYEDTSSSVSTRIRNNEFNEVGCGVQLQLGDCSLRSGGLLVKQVMQDASAVTVETHLSHDVTPGEWIALKVVDSPERRYAQVQTVGERIIGATVLGGPLPSGRLVWGKVWHRGRMEIHGNRIRIAMVGDRVFHGITAQGSRLPEEIRIFRELAITQNDIRWITRAPKKFAPIVATHAEYLEVRNNVVPTGGQIIPVAKSRWLENNLSESYVEEELYDAAFQNG